ncbi:MAG: hypothetical protein IJF71_00090 [Clostridia bacterium]|nr:hypothetical protein [Clostridia bacterium]
MKKVKALSFILCLLLASVSLLACGGPGSGPTLPGFQDGKKNLVFFIYDNEALYNGLAEEFEALPGNENINIVIQKATDSYYEELQTSYIGAQTPDIVFMKTSEIIPFLSGKTPKLLALDSFIESSDVIGWDDLWAVNDGYRYNAQTGLLGDKNAPLYGLIKDFSPDWTLIYNKELYNSAVNAMQDKDMAATIRAKLDMNTTYPSDMTGKKVTDYALTWSEYYAISQQVKKSYGTVNGTILDTSPEMLIMQWIQQNGEYLFTEDDKYCKSITGTPAILEAFELFRKMQDGAASPANWSNTTAGSAILLNQGKVASTTNGRWAFNEYDWIDNLSNLGVMASPVPDDYDTQEATKYTLSSAIGGCMSLCITSKCEYPEDAWSFIEYFFTEFQKRMATEGYNISGNRKVAEEYFLSENQTPEHLALNTFYYNLSLSSDTMRYNRYLGTEAIYNVMWLNFKEYFYDTNHDSTDPNNAKWIACLNNIEKDLNNELSKYWA